MNDRQPIQSVLRNLVSVVAVVGIATGCSSFEPVFVPEGTRIETPATITVAIDKEIDIVANEIEKAIVEVSKIGDFEVADTRMHVDVRLDPNLKIARLQAWELEFKARDGKTSRSIDGFLVDANGLSEFEVQCDKPKTKKAPEACAKATLLPRSDPISIILLAPIELGGTTLMGKMEHDGI